MLSIIVCCCKNYSIGRQAKLLHHIKEDLIFFKNLTLNKTVIVGRKTYESIPNRLQNRKVILITSNKNYKCSVRNDIIISNDIENVLKIIPNNEEVFVIGGGEIYKQMIKFVDKIYMTIVDDECNGDCYFENFYPKDWDVLTESFFFEKTQNLKYKRIIYCRK